MIYVRRPRLELGTVPLGGDRAVQLRQRRIAVWAAEDSNRSAYTPVRFRGGACTLADSLSMIELLSHPV